MEGGPKWKCHQGNLKLRYSTQLSDKRPGNKSIEPKRHPFQKIWWSWRETYLLSRCTKTSKQMEKKKESCKTWMSLWNSWARRVWTPLRSTNLTQKRLLLSIMSINTSFTGLIPTRVFKRSPLMRSLTKHSAFSSLASPKTFSLRREWDNWSWRTSFPGKRKACTTIKALPLLQNIFSPIK